jgi:hypothetical protein
MLRLNAAQVGVRGPAGSWPCITLFRLRGIYCGATLARTRPMNSGQFRKGELHGKQFPKGEHHPKTKLTVTQVLTIFRDPRSHHAIARDYGIHHTGVSEIKTGKTWRHVTAPLTDRRGSQRGGHIKWCEGHGCQGLNVADWRASIAGPRPTLGGRALPLLSARFCRPMVRAEDCSGQGSQGRRAASVQRPRLPFAWMRSGAGMVRAGRKAGFIAMYMGTLDYRMRKIGDGLSVLACLKGFGNQLANDFCSGRSLLFG